MSEVTLNSAWWSSLHRGTTLMRKRAPPWDHHRVLGIGLQGYLGHKKTLAEGSVGLRFIEIRKPSENLVGPISLGLRRRTKVVGPRFLKI